MPNKIFPPSVLLWTKIFSDSLSLCITKWKLSKHDIKVNYKDTRDTDFWKTPRHIHWIFDVMIKREHKKDQVHKFVSFLYDKWNKLDSVFCSQELERLYNKKKDLDSLFNDIKKDLEEFKTLDIHGYFP